LVVSDIHYPERVTNIPDLSDYVRDANIIFGLGDFTTLEVVEYLKSFNKPFVAVYGNKDEQTLKLSLPETTVIEIEKVKIGLYHGNLGPQGIEKRVKEKFGKKRLDAYVFGHSHIAVKRYIDGAFYFNPGALSGIRQTFGFIYVDFGNIWGEIKKYKNII
jgi:putative phosphoesterase